MRLITQKKGLDDKIKAGLLKPDFSDELHDYLIMNSIFK